MLRVWTAILLAVVLLLSWQRTLALEPQRERGLLPIDPPTPFDRFIPEGTPRGRVLVVHGLAASRNFMQVFCSALTDAGFEVYSIDLPGHGDSPVGFSAIRSRDAVGHALDHLGNIDIVLGHSLGAGLLLDLASDRELPRTVLLSPPPTPLDHVNLSRTLVVTGDWDIPAVNTFAPRLEGAEWWRLPWTAHSSVLFNAGQTRDIVRWMGGNAQTLRTRSRMFWNALLLVSSIGLGVGLMKPRAADYLSNRNRWDITQACGWFALAGAASVIILRFAVVLRFLRLFAADYLLSAMFLIGILLTLVRPGRGRPIPRARGLAIAVLAAGYVIAVVGVFAGSRFMHFTLSDGRWWRFPLIAVISFPLFFVDEIALRTESVWKTAAIGVLTRALAGAAILTGVLLFNHEAAFLGLITHLVVLFWIALWFLTDVVRRHTQDPTGAALFASIVQGWILAAWFVTV